ncbi:hypothetical protein OROMI_014110 [Orobanche minor]
MSLDQENKLVTINNDEEDTNMENNTSLLVGLNLVLIISLLSLPSDECSNSKETTREIWTRDLHHKSKHGSCSPARGREIDQFGRQTSKVHTKMRDSRALQKIVNCVKSKTYVVSA